MRWQFFLFCLTVEHNIFSWFQFASVSSPRLGCHCHINIIDANIVSVVVILFIQLAVVITFSCFYFIPLACSLYRYWIQQLFFCQSVYIFYQSKSLFLQSFFFFFFIAFMTESICLLIYTKREKYMTYLQYCFCLIFT